MDTVFENLLAKALRNRVSDVHFRHENGHFIVEMRTINGIVRLPEGDYDRLFNYLQYLAHLDPTSSAMQSGGFTYFYRGSYYDFRLATINSVQKCDGVLRVLNCHNGLSLSQLTYDASVQKLFCELLKQRSGLIVFSGLTGCGKTTTMYSLLADLPGKSIYSLEDPIEVVQENIIQLAISEKQGLDYEQAIKQILRHNPDILMIGEIRDEKAAKMSIRAALTGTLVLTSLHAGSATMAISRLLDLGVRANDLAEVTLMIFNQRLVKLRKQKQYTGVYDYLNNQQVRRYLSGQLVENHMQEKLDEAVSQEVIDGKWLYG